MVSVHSATIFPFTFPWKRVAIGQIWNGRTTLKTMKSFVLLCSGLTTILCFRALAADPAPNGATNAWVSAEKTSFKEVTSQLDPGGNLYLYLGTAQWLEGLS